MDLTRSKRLGSMMSAGVVLGALLAGCGGSSADDAPPRAAVDASSCEKLAQRETVTVGVFPNLSLGSYFAADAFGYFEEQNLDVEVAQLSTTQDAIALLAQDQIDAAITGVSANLFNSVAADFHVRAVGSQGQTTAGTKQPSGFFVRSELIESGDVESMEDLSGRKIGITGTVGGATSYLVSLMLEQGGLALEDITTVTLAPPEMQEGLTSGAIDAAFIGSPYSTQVEEAGVGRLFGDQDVLADQTYGAIVFGPDLLEDRPEVGRAFLRGNMQAARNELAGAYNEDPELVAGLAEATGFEKEFIAATPPYRYDPDLAFSTESLEAQQEVFDQAGVLNAGSVPVEGILDEDMRTSAAKTLDACGSDGGSGN